MAGNQGRRLSCVAGIWMGLIIILLVAQALVAEAAADDQTVNESPCVSACRKKCFACYFRRCYVLPWCFNKCKAKCSARVVSEAINVPFNCAKHKCSKFAPDLKEFEVCANSCNHDCNAK
ncbi:uncharacterized protein LOC131309820 [Rhododendron vialii]|uniref:uncharacterized protein LOC131309820 n=1 Tax=Rhododendron vialii TaxID=182163 RepID=UPI00265E262B|nr:uncharacterized protein LOC131309820 [Rhododendron vialii]